MKHYMMVVLHACMHTYVYIHTFMHACIHTSTHTHTLLVITDSTARDSVSREMLDYECDVIVSLHEQF
jgi:hypothetical protein